MKMNWIKICFVLFFISVSNSSDDYGEVEFVVETVPSQMNQPVHKIRSSSPSRSPSRPSPSRPAPRPSPTSRPASRPSPTSRPAARPSPPSRPSPSPTYRPSPAWTHKPAPRTTARPPSPPSTYRPQPPSTYRPQPPSTYKPQFSSTYKPYSPSTHRPFSPLSTQRSSITTYKPYTTPQSIMPPPTSRSWTTARPSQPVWTPAQSRTLAPPLRYTTGRPQLWTPQGSFQTKPKPSGGLSSLFKSLTGSGTTARPGYGAYGPKPTSKMAKVKQLATALYGAYKGRKLKQKVSRNQHRSYSPYYGRNYYYGNRYYRNTNPGYRITCYYYIPSNDPTYDMYYEDQGRVTEIVYECDAQYERCCGNVDCCRNNYAVNGRGMGTGQSVYMGDPGYQEYDHQGAPPNPPPMVDENAQVYEVYAENYNFENLSDDDFVSFNETIYTADNETLISFNYFENFTNSTYEYGGQIQKIF